MRFIAGLIVLIFVGVSGWFVGSQLSPDAIGMAVGILFGIMASIPVMIMVLASRNQADQFYGQHQPEPPAPPQVTINQTHYHYHAPPAERVTVDQFLAAQQHQIEMRQ